MKPLKNKLPSFSQKTPDMKCPCGGVYAADISSYSVTHTYPICEYYENLEVTDFLQWARENGAVPLLTLS